MRACDVYVGVDVWGRGTNSGGGYNTITDVALIAHQGMVSTFPRLVGLSCALFAPGWIFEHEFDCEFSAAYEQKEREFWNSTVTSATEDGQLLLSKSSTCIANYVDMRPAVLGRVGSGPTDSCFPFSPISRGCSAPWNSCAEFHGTLRRIPRGSAACCRCWMKRPTEGANWRENGRETTAIKETAVWRSAVIWEGRRSGRRLRCSDWTMR